MNFLDLVKQRIEVLKILQRDKEEKDRTFLIRQLNFLAEELEYSSEKINYLDYTKDRLEDLKILQKYKEDKERTFLIHQLEFLITDYRNLKGEKTEIDNNMI